MDPTITPFGPRKIFNRPESKPAGPALRDKIKGSASKAGNIAGPKIAPKPNFTPSERKRLGLGPGKIAPKPKKLASEQSTSTVKANETAKGKLASKSTKLPPTIAPKPVLTIEQQSKLIENILQDWVKEQKNNSLYYQEAATRIILFLRDPDTNELDLSELNLEQLPNIFHLAPINTKLESLNLTSNYLKSLPPGFSQLKSLKELDLNYNNFETFPLEICKIITLDFLKLIGNALRELPSEISQLRALKTLGLNRNNFEKLPLAVCSIKSLENLYLFGCGLTELPPEIGQLTSLKKLYLGGEYLGMRRAASNSLRTLPPEITNLTQLEVLDLTFNSFERLPPQICQLNSLKELDLALNLQLEELPMAIAQLRSLTRLDLSNTVIRRLPQEILQLPQGCDVELPSSLSNAVLVRLREATQQTGYSGPTFNYSMHEVPSEEKTIEELFEQLFAIAGKTPIEFAALRQDPEKAGQLRAWLSHLSYAADFKSGGAFQKSFVNRIFEYLTLAENDPKFREDVFFPFIKDASKTCGDRVTLSVMHLGIQFQLATMDIKDMKKVADFLAKGVWAVSLLEEVARNKVSTLRFCDEITIYLGYPVKLREKLELPIDVKDMLYFSLGNYSALTQEDLDIAEEYVKAKLGNKEEFHALLIDQPTWQKSLEANFGNRMAALERAKAAAQKVKSPDYAAIDKEYKKGLLELTREALGETPAKSVKKPVFTPTIL